MRAETAFATGYAGIAERTADAGALPLSLREARHLLIFDDPSPEGGGIQNMAYWIARSLAERGFKVVVAGLQEHLNAPAFAGVAVERFTLRWRFRGRYTADLRLLSLLLRLRLRYGKDVILYSMVINNVRVFRWLNPLLGWRCVSFLHGNETLRLAARRPEVLRRNLRACVRVFANSRYTRALAGRVGEFPNVAVLEPGIPAAQFCAPSGRDLRQTLGWGARKVILMLSRLSRRKGHLLVLDALAELLPRHPDLLLAIAGRGPLQDVIEERICDLGLTDHVVLLGEVPEQDKADLYRAADVFCMPSDMAEASFEVEGFGIVYLEAAAAGTVAVGAEGGGVCDAIQDRVTGLLVPPGNRRALVGVLDCILARPGEFERMRERARQRACSEFDWPQRVDRLLRSLGEVLG